MTPQTVLRLPSPVMLDLRVSIGPRPRVVSGDQSSPISPPADPVWHEFSEFPLHVHFDATARTIAAYLPPLPRPLPLYGPEDFSAAAGDTTDDHSRRALQLLGNTPADILQALIDGHELPPLPPRVPREIANWRARAVLEMQGLLPAVEAIIQSMQSTPGPEAIIVRTAWQSGSPLARHGPTVTTLAPALGLTPSQVDTMFIAAEKLVV